MFLRVSDLSKRFDGLAALTAVTFDLPAGKVLGVLGANGSGKSTLLDLLTGLIKPDAGDIVLAGESLLNCRADQVAARKVTRMRQHLSAFDSISAWDYAALGLWPRGRRHYPTSADADKVALALSSLSVWAKRHRALRSLSYFERREADFARCLVSEPRLLLIDELASGLTEPERDFFSRQLGKLGDTSMIVVEHDPDFLRPVAHDVLVLDQGRVIGHGPTSAYFATPPC